jgi:hypothetical protein
MAMTGNQCNLEAATLSLFASPSVLETPVIAICVTHFGGQCFALLQYRNFSDGMLMFGEQNEIGFQDGNSE